MKIGVGTKVGYLKVLKLSRRDSTGHDFWSCHCLRCGVRTVVRGDRLRHKSEPTLSCGCLSFGIRKREPRQTPPPVVGARWVPLTQGKFALVDEADFECVSKFNWSVGAQKYAGRRDGEKYIFLHRFLLGAQAGETVDHINHDGMDDRRSNLRAATKTQQMQNRHKQTRNTSGSKGVWFDKRQNIWVAEIRVLKNKVNLGRFKEINEATRAYDAAAKRFFGEFAFTNADMARRPL